MGNMPVVLLNDQLIGYAEQYKKVLSEGGLEETLLLSARDDLEFAKEGARLLQKRLVNGQNILYEYFVQMLEDIDMLLIDRLAPQSETARGMHPNFFWWRLGGTAFNDRRNELLKRQKYGRWSRPFDLQDPELNRYIRVPSSQLFAPLDEFVSELARTVDLVEKAGDNNEALAILEDFDDYGYISGQYGQDLISGSIYYENWYEPLKLLTEAGYDVRHLWRSFEENTARIWKLLPRFFKYLSPPQQGLLDRTSWLIEGYDPEKPFPMFPVPEDID